MSETTKTINWLIDSSWRNRVKYPDAGEFVVEVDPVKAYQNTSPGYTVSPSGTVFTIANQNYAQDPVMLSFPFDAGSFSQNTIGAFLSSPTIFFLDTRSSPVVNFYVNRYICVPFHASTTDEYWAPVIYYDPYNPTNPYETLTEVPWPGGGGTLPLATDPYYMTYNLPVKVSNTANQEYYTLTTADSTSFTNIQFTMIYNPTFYLGKYVVLFATDLTTPYADKYTCKYQWALITSYDSTTGFFTLNKGLFRQVASNAQLLLQTGQKIRIMDYSYDNARSLKLAATSTFNNPHCTNANITVSIPEAPILNSYHGYINDYPYIMVVVQNAVMKNNSQTIVSNVPFTEPVTYVLPVQYLSAVDSASQRHFIINGLLGGKNILMNTRDSLLIKVLLPNGEPIVFDWASLGIPTYFNGLGYPIPSDPFANIQIFLAVDFTTPQP